MRKVVVFIIFLLLIVTTITSLKSISYQNKSAIISFISQDYTQNDWIKVQKLFSLDSYKSQMFGSGVSIDENIAIIGAWGDDENGNGAGAAYVFENINGIWIQKAKLLPSDGDAGDLFGWGISVSGDTAIIGARVDDDNGEDSGSAYIFRKIGDSWIQEAKLLPSDGEPGDWFGKSVSISGNNAIIGSWYDDDNGPQSGSAYIFERLNGNWVEKQKLKGSIVNHACFGGSVAIDGDSAIIGAWAESDRGRAFIYEKIGGIWVLKAKLLGFDTAIGDAFGADVSIFNETAVVSAQGNHPYGSAYIFHKTNNSWVQQAKLVPSDGSSRDLFSVGNAICGDIAIIGSWKEDDYGLDYGSAYVFQRINGSWVEKQKLGSSDGANGGEFGKQCSISKDTILISAMGDDDNGDFSGSAYIFKKFDGNFPPIKPTINGTTRGKPETLYNYTFTAIDPDGDNMTYVVKWGDGDIDEGSVESDDSFSLSHSWDKKGDYLIRALLIDEYGIESDWGELQITMSRNKAVIGNMLLLRLLERFPLLQQLWNIWRSFIE